ELESANGLKNVGALRVNQEIKIPAKSATKTPPDAKGAAANLKDSGDFYTVARGDTPLTIAKKFRVSAEELLKLNKIEDPKKIQIGQKLKLPVKHKSDVAITP
ncbi:MAG: hypothetical protein QOD99_454, partial [Chthoniobacter sp.]|nr:hypothetical protein [Chthoniobacter sp.]